MIRIWALFVFILGAGYPVATVSGQGSGQGSDLSKLVHPDVAERLSLSDAQRVQLQQIILDRSTALAEASDDAAKEAVRKRFDELALAELSEEQREKLATDQPYKGLVFQFRDMKWDNVLSWFAAQQDLTLVMDQVPPGSFTYSDTRSYSPAEAIDLLNSVLMTRGFTLVRRERILSVMELKDSLPIDLLPRVEISELPERGKFELVSVVFPIGNRPIETVLNEVRPYLNTYGRIMPLARGTQVLVVENAGKMQTINELIANVPETKEVAERRTPPQLPVFASYSIGDLDPRRTFTTIQTLIRSDNISIDEQTGVLSAFVIPSQQTAIKSAIDAMIEKQATLPEMKAVAYRLLGIGQADFRDQVTPLAPAAKIMTTGDRALVLASPAEHERIEKSLAALNIKPIGLEDEVRNFEVAPTKIASIELALKSFIPNSLIASDRETGSMIVKGTEEELRTADEIIQIWKNAPDAIQLKIYPLTENQRDRRTSLAPLPGDLVDVKFVDSSSGNEWMVWATEKQHQKLAEYLQQLDQPLPAPDSAIPQVYSLDVKDIALVVELLTAEFPKAKFNLDTSNQQLTAIAESELQEKIAAKIEELHEHLPSREEQALAIYQSPGMTAVGLQQTLAAELATVELANVRIQPDVERNRLLVWADASQHERIAKFVERLAEKPPVEYQRVVVVYPLKHATATVAKASLDQLATTATIVADDKMKQLMITGTISDHSTFTPVIEQIDRPKSSSNAPQVRSFDLEKMQAIRILPMLQTLWPDMQMSADPTSNTVVVSGTEDELEQFGKAMKQMLEEPDGKTQTIKTYPVPAGNIYTLPTVLTQIAPQSIVSSDPVSRTVTVLTTEALHERISQAIEQITSTAQAAKRPVSYLVKPTQLASVQLSIRTLFPYSTMSADATSGQLIVLASQSEHDEIAKVVELLVDGPNAMERRLEVFPVEPKLMESPEFLTSLRALLPAHVNIQPSLKTNSIVAIGTPDELKLVEEHLKQVVEQLPVPEELTTAVHTLNYATTSTAMVVLQPLVPTAVLIQDPAARTIAATASAEDHKKIEELLELLDVPRQNDQVTKVYRMNQGTGQSVAYVLAGLMPDARLIGDPTGGALLASATERQHEIIQSVADEYGGANEELETRVFSLVRADGLSLQQSLQQSNVKAKVVVERGSNSLIVTGTPQSLDEVELLVSQVEGSSLGEHITQFYAVDNASPSTLAIALQKSFPKATVVGDAAGGGIFVTAPENQQTTIKELVDQLNAQPTRLPSLQSFPIQHVAPGVVARSLREAYGGRRSTANVTFNEETKSLFVVGTREELKIAEQLIQLVDVADATRQERQMKVFPTAGLNGTTVTEALTTAFRDDAEPIDVQHDFPGGRLYVFGTTEQLDRAAQLMESFAPAPRDMQVLPMGKLDPFLAKQAVDSLFADTPINQSPVVTVDYDQQQLLVKATQEQLDQIRSLLSQMGAPAVPSAAGVPQSQLDATASSDFAHRSRIRSVPTFRNADRVLGELQRIWPDLRENPLKVLQSNSLDESTSSEQPSPNETETSSEDGTTAPPVILVVGEGQWTIASEDMEALDHLERVLDVIRSPRAEPLVSTGNYSVYLLQRASAAEMQDTLLELLRPDPRQPRSSALSDAYRRIKIVADARTNSLIVSGTENDRRLVEDLLGVLDSEELMGSLQQIVPTSIRLESANAEQAYSILRDIYRSQLTTNVPRRPLPIPEGVSPEVATLLQQLNAQASSPILAITVNEITNSLVLRAPPDLTDEIRKFVKSLDDQTASTPSRRVELIRLESTNTKSIEQALRRLLSK